MYRNQCLLNRARACNLFHCDRVKLRKKCLSYQTTKYFMATIIYIIIQWTKANKSVCNHSTKENNHRLIHPINSRFKDIITKGFSKRISTNCVHRLLQQQILTLFSSFTDSLWKPYNHPICRNWDSAETFDKMANPGAQCIEVRRAPLIHFQKIFFLKGFL